MATSAHLYDAECALHAAHQSHVEAWIGAASEKLHEAVADHLAAIAAATSQSASGDTPVAARVIR